MFQTVFPSIIRGSKLHIQRQVFVRPLLLLAATCTASYRNKYIVKCCILLVVLCECISDARTYECWISQTININICSGFAYFLQAESFTSLRPSAFQSLPNQYVLTLYLLTWRIWWSPNNASKGQVGFNSAFKGLNTSISFQGT